MKSGPGQHLNNIGTLRFIGAFMVLFGHSFNLSSDNHLTDPVSVLLLHYMPWTQPLQTLGVILFFGISGYLVTKSYLNKNDLFDYLLARCMRIFPALVVAVMFCVFVVGLVHTTLSTMDYFRDPMTKEYLWVNSTLISIRFILPGVFVDWPLALSVNGSLWTLPTEFRLYLVVALLGVLRVFAYRWLFNIVILFAAAGFLYWLKWVPPLWAPQAPYLVISFLLGMFLCVNEKIIAPDGKNLAILLVLCVMAWHWNKWGIYNYVSLATFIVAVLYLGLYCPLRMPPLDRFGDFSYGLYLYAFPVQQTLVGLVGPGKPWVIVVLSLFCTLLLAALSWRWIEKPAMTMAKNYLKSRSRR